LEFKSGQTFNSSYNTTPARWISTYIIINAKVFRQKNYGKGRAVQHGIKKSLGKYILIQDGDLEYNPEDIISMCNVVETSQMMSIYGSRYKPLYLNILPHRHLQHFPNFPLHKFFDSTKKKPLDQTSTYC